LFLSNHSHATAADVPRGYTKDQPEIMPAVALKNTTGRQNMDVLFGRDRFSAGR
jgi:hypothetical protein